MIDMIRLPADDALTVWFVEPDPRPRPQAATMMESSVIAEDLARRVPFGVFGPIREVPVSEQFTIQTITKPRHLRDGSVTDEQVTAVFEAFAAGKVPKGEAVVICRNVEKENTARNRARTVATRAKELHGDKEAYRPLAAHAIPDPQNEGKFIGAVSIKPEPKPKLATPDKPAAPAARK